MPPLFVCGAMGHGNSDSHFANAYWSTLIRKRYQELQQCPKKGVAGALKSGTVSRKFGGNAMLVHVDIVTAFDQSTGHRSRYVLSSADEPEIMQSITLQAGTEAASAIRSRLLASGRAEGFYAAMKRSIEQPGAPQRLGSIEIDDGDPRSMTHLQGCRKPLFLRGGLVLPGDLV